VRGIALDADRCRAAAAVPSPAHGAAGAGRRILVYWQQSVVAPDGVTLPLAVDGVVTVHADSWPFVVHTPDRDAVFPVPFPRLHAVQPVPIAHAVPEQFAPVKNWAPVSEQLRVAEAQVHAPHFRVSEYPV
jgi:hypothetical protein